MHSIRLAAALALTLSASAACATHTTPDTAVQGPEFTVEVVNTMPHAMNVSYELGTEVTALGSVDANQTRRFTIPNRGTDEIRMIATDQGQTHTVDGRIDLEGDAVRRWEIK